MDNLAETAAGRLTTGLLPDRLDVTVRHPDVDIIEVEVRYQAPLLTRMIFEVLGGPGRSRSPDRKTMVKEGDSTRRERPGLCRMRGFIWFAAGIVLALLAGFVAHTSL